MPTGFSSYIFYFLLIGFLYSCQATDLQYKIIEEKPIDTFIGNVKTDSNLRSEMTDQEYSQLQFQILTEGNQYAQLFSITDDNGILKSASIIDREDVCVPSLQCFLEFSVSVFKRDVNDPDKLKFVKVLIIGVEIKDINDNPPVFLEPEIIVNISESVSIGHIILTSTAIDKDSGVNNSVQIYEISSSDDTFGVQLIKNPDETSNLGIIVNKQLDRETKSLYQVTIIAKDYGSPQRNGTLSVKINIIDANDNAPKFSQLSYTISIIENPPIGLVLLRVLATDFDIGKNGNVTYHFGSRTSKVVTRLLSLNEFTGELNVKGTIDFEVNQFLQFYIQAKDQGLPAKTAQTIVTINVTDINDNSPKINVNFPPGGELISEDSKIGQYIATISVQDEDGGINGTVSCSIKDNTFELTKVFKNIYKINLKTKLDREDKAQHNVTVSCSDFGTPPKHNSTSFVINVGDVNDNEPKFSEFVYRPTIYENNAVGDIVAIVTAIDPDEGKNGEVSYSISSNANSVFSISSSSGIITANKLFDREETDQYEFNVTAFDNGTPRFSSTVFVVVTIGDKNDHIPVYSKSLYTFTIQENLIPGTIIGGVVAYDNDTDSNGRLMFSQSHPFSSIFQIKQNTGEIMVIDLVDRESKDLYEFNVTVSDHGLPPKTSSARIKINVKDENDNFPVITFPTKINNSIQIPSSLEVNSFITKVTALDLDLGKNAELTYHIIQGDQFGHFHLQNKTGRIILNKLFRSHDLGTYKLLIAVQDEGIPQRTSWANLELVVSSDEGRQNMLIAITVCAITAILSASMIVVICIIRKRDSLKENQLKVDPQKTSFIHGWLRCLSTSTKELQGLGNGITTKTLRTEETFDRKPMVGRSTDDNDCMDNKNIKVQENMIQNREEGELQTSSDGGNKNKPTHSNIDDKSTHNNDGIWTTDKYFCIEQRITYEDKPEIMYHKRYTPESYGQILQTAISDLSLSDNWKQRKHSKQPQYDRNMSLDEEILCRSGRSLHYSASGLRSNYDFEGLNLQDSGFFSQTDTLQSNHRPVKTYESHSLNRHLGPSNHINKSVYGSTRVKHKQELPTINSTPEPYINHTDPCINQSFEGNSSNIIEPPPQFLGDSDLHVNHSRNKYTPQQNKIQNYTNISDYIELEDNVFNNDLVV